MNKGISYGSFEYHKLLPANFALDAHRVQVDGSWSQWFQLALSENGEKTPETM